MKRFLLLLRSNWITALGSAVTTISFMAFVTTVVFLTMHGAGHGPYAGLFAFIVLPALFLVGLVLIPIGLVIYRRQLADRTAAAQAKPFRILRVLGFLTLINLAVLGTGGYEAMHYMDSQQFCGTLCHEVMSPTYEAYLTSPHARVACVECHIGPGASWFVKSKLSGLRQVLAVLSDSYQRPIPTPVHNLRPARDTCEQCHWPDKFTGDRLIVRRHFENDEAVTPKVSVLVLKTGGTRPNGEPTGIHWHVHPGNRVSYYSTGGKRREIPWVSYRDAEGNERVFVSVDYEGDLPPESELRTMDCVDCHNQPSHAFDDPGDAIDRAIAMGQISREFPFVRKVGLEALRLGWTRDNVEEGIERHLRTFYEKNGGLPEGKESALAGIASTLAAIWRRNVHPMMGITWGTYPHFTTHEGCMRCHDDDHEDEDGEVISSDCDLCHVTLAEEEENPEILEQLGLSER